MGAYEFDVLKLSTSWEAFNSAVDNEEKEKKQKSLLQFL
jgi:hypothetical protein